MTLPLDLHVVRAPGGGETVESVPVTYRVDAGFEIHDVLSVRPLCMADGAVLVLAPLGLGEDEVPWPLRLPDGTWESVSPDAALEEAFGIWDAVALHQHVMFTVSESGGPAHPKPARAFDLVSQSWHPLPDLTGNAIPHSTHRAGPRRVAVLPTVPDRDDRPTVLEAP